MLSMSKECPTCKSHGKINNLRLCKINYTECVYICTNEFCSYPSHYPWEYVPYNLFDDSEDEGNTSEEIERDILNFAAKRNEIRNLNVPKCIPTLVGDNKPKDSGSFQFNESNTQLGIDSNCLFDLNPNKLHEQDSRSELKTLNSDNSKESISTEKNDVIGNKNKQNKFKIDIKSVVIYNNKDEFKANFNTLKSVEINNKDIKNYGTGVNKPIVLSGSVITSPNDKSNTQSVPLKFIKVENVDTHNFIPCATNKKITLKFLNQSKNCKIVPNDTKYSDKLFRDDKFEPLKCEIPSTEIQQPGNKTDFNFLDFSPDKQKSKEVKHESSVKKSLIFSPVKYQHISKKMGSNTIVGLKTENEKIKQKNLIRNTTPLPKIIDEIDLSSKPEILSPIKKNKIMKRKQSESTKKVADILNHYLGMTDDKEQGAPIKETSVKDTNVDIKKFVGIVQKSAAQYSGFSFKSKGNLRKKNKKQIINKDITEYNIDCPSNNIKSANIIVEESASTEQMTPLKMVEATMEENVKCDQELDDMLGEFLQNVDIADINPANLSTNCNDLTEWLDLL